MEIFYTLIDCFKELKKHFTAKAFFKLLFGAALIVVNVWLFVAVNNAVFIQEYLR